MAFIQVLSDARAREKPCIRCGYSLRGNLDARYCPECGLSVWLSLNQNDALEWSNPPWLTTLSLASWILAFVQLFGLLGWCLMLAAPLSPTIVPVGRAVTGIYLIVYHVLVLGLLCRHEQRYPDRLKSFRHGLQIVAGCAIIIGLLLLLGAAVGLAAHSSPAPPRPMDADDLSGPSGIDFLFVFIELTLACSALATWLYLRNLARRVPSSTVSRICSWLLLMPLIPVAKALPFFTFYIAYMVPWLFTLALLVYFPGTAILFGWFAVAFKRCSSSAAENWANESIQRAAIVAGSRTQ